MPRRFAFALTIVAGLAALPVLAAETNSSGPPPQSENGPTQSTPVPPPVPQTVPQTAPQRDCERDDAIS
jgi:hypothetical protein